MNLDKKIMKEIAKEILCFTLACGSVGGVYETLRNASVDQFKDNKQVMVYGNPNANSQTEGIELKLFGNEFYPFGVNETYTDVPIATKCDEHGYPIEFSKLAKLTGKVSIDPKYGRALETEDGDKYVLTSSHDSHFLKKLD